MLAGVALMENLRAILAEIIEDAAPWLVMGGLIVIAIVGILLS